MQVTFDIVIVIAIVAIMLWLFARSLRAKVDAGEVTVVLRIVIAGIIFILGVIAVWYVRAGSTLSPDWWVDTVSYDSGGLYIAQQFRSGNLDISAINASLGSVSNPGYYFLVGIIYTVFGHQEWMVSIFNALAVVVLAMMMYHIAICLFNPKVARWTLVLTVFLPFFVHTSFYMVRDNIVTLLVVAAAWSLITLNQKGMTLRGVILPVVFVLCLLPFRPQYAIIIGLLMPLYLIFTSSASGGKRLVFALIVLVLVVGLVSLVQPQGYSWLSVMKTQTFEPTAYHTNVPDFLQGISPGHFGDVWGRIVAHPVAFLQYSLEGTFLLFWGSSQLYSRTGPSIYPIWWSLDAIFRIILMPMVLYGLYYCLRYHRGKTFLLYAFPLVLTVALVLFAGADNRWGLPMMPFIMMFGAIGCVHFDRIRFLYPVYLIVFAIAATLNTSLFNGTLGMFLLITGVLIALLLTVHIVTGYRRIGLRWERFR